MENDKFCRFDHNELACVLVSLSSGCVCYSEDKQQWLCWQHYYKIGELGSLKILKDFRNAN